MELKFNKNFYPKTVLIKSAYNFTDKAYIHLDEIGDYYIVNIDFKDGNAFNYLDFENEMLCQAARYEVYRQTKDLRKLTVARALASTVINNMEESETVEDDIEADVDIDSVLKDWFEANE